MAETENPTVQPQEGEEQTSGRLKSFLSNNKRSFKVVGIIAAIFGALLVLFKAKSPSSDDSSALQLDGSSTSPNEPYSSEA